jgi:hypothetical protein
MKIELKEIIFGFEIVENLFQMIENEMIMDSFLRSIEKPKVEDVVPFRGGLPQMPLIVGLAGALPDGVNNLISKFVGYQSKAVTAMKQVINEVWLPNKWPDWELNLYILQHKRRMIRGVIGGEYYNLKGYKSINRRKEEFAKLPKWLRKGLRGEYGLSLFPQTLKNEIFIREQTM